MMFNHWCWQQKEWLSVVFKKINILSAVVTLLASYYVFNADYPKGHGGHSKNVYLFLEYILLQRSRHALPINVEAVVGKLK